MPRFEGEVFLLGTAMVLSAAQPSCDAGVFTMLPLVEG